MITATDLYCYIDERRGLEYKDVEFKVADFGLRESTVRNPKTGGVFKFDNSFLYATIPQRVRSIQERKENAANIGTFRKRKGKNR